MGRLLTMRSAARPGEGGGAMIEVTGGLLMA